MKDKQQKYRMELVAYVLTNRYNNKQCNMVEDLGYTRQSMYKWLRNKQVIPFLVEKWCEDKISKKEIKRIKEETL